MKRKAINSTLIILVLLIWGGVIARAFNRPVPVVPPEKLAVHEGEIGEEVKEERPPLKLDRDPFLDGGQNRQPTGASARPANNRIAAVPKKTVAPPAESPSPWPSILYHGLVSNTQEIEKRVGFISINGKQRMLGAGSISDGVIVHEVRLDSVVVQWGADRRSFGRN